MNQSRPGFPPRKRTTSSAISWRAGIWSFPWLIEAILELRPTSVLDYGAGDGKFLAELRQQFAGELWHYDPSPALEAKAKQLLGSADVRFCQDAKSLGSQSIDVVSSIAVWMTLPSHQACLQYLAEQH